VSSLHKEIARRVPENYIQISYTVVIIATVEERIINKEAARVMKKISRGG
jgi:hypothetical protein